MTTIRLDPRDYAVASDDVLQGERRLRRDLGTARSAMNQCYNMAGSDNGGEQFAASYDGAANGLVDRLEELSDGMREWSRALMACGALHANADHLAAGGTGSVAGFTDPGAGFEVCFGALQTSSGGNSSPVPGFEFVVDLIGYVWPDADTGKLRTASRAWQALSGDLRSMASEVDSWSSHLAGIDSPEKAHIIQSLNALSDDLSACADYAWGNDEGSLATACSMYADQVDEVHESSLVMLRDLAIEIAAGVAVSVALSFVTFGGAAAVGGAAMAARITYVAGKISASLGRLLAAAGRLANSIRIILMRIKTLKRWADFMAKGTRLTRVTYSFTDNALGAFGASFFTEDDTNPAVAAFSSGVAGVFGDALTSARYLDNFAGKAFAGGLEGVLEYGVSETLGDRNYSAQAAILSTGMGTVGGAVRSTVDVGGSAAMRSIDARMTSKAPTLSGSATPGAQVGGVSHVEVDAPTNGGAAAVGVVVAGGGVTIHSDSPTTGGSAPDGVVVAGGGVDVHSDAPVSTDISGEVAIDVAARQQSAEADGPEISTDIDPVDVDVDAHGGDGVATSPAGQVPAHVAGPPVDATVDAHAAPTAPAEVEVKAPAGTSAVEPSPGAATAAATPDSTVTPGQAVEGDAAPVRPVEGNADSVPQGVRGLDSDGTASTKADIDTTSQTGVAKGDTTVSTEAGGTPDSAKAKADTDLESSGDAGTKTDSARPDGEDTAIGDGDATVHADAAVDASASATADGHAVHADPADGDGVSQGAAGDSEVGKSATDGEVAAGGPVKMVAALEYPQGLTVLEVDGQPGHIRVEYINAAGETVISRPLPPPPSLDGLVLESNGKAYTQEMWAYDYDRATHNMENPTDNTAMLGRFEKDSVTSYERQATDNVDYAHFNMKDGRWDEVSKSLGIDNDAMYRLFNRPFMDEVQSGGMNVRFSHDPRGFLPDELPQIATADGLSKVDDLSGVPSLGKELYELKAGGYAWQVEPKLMVAPPAPGS